MLSARQRTNSSPTPPGCTLSTSSRNEITKKQPSTSAKPRGPSKRYSLNFYKQTQTKRGTVFKSTWKLDFLRSNQQKKVRDVYWSLGWSNLWCIVWIDWRKKGIPMPDKSRKNLKNFSRPTQTQSTRNWSISSCNPMAGYEISSDSQTERIISRWLWCTTFQRKHMKKPLNTWETSKMRGWWMWSTNTHISFSDMRPKRLFRCSPGASETSNRSSWCPDSWTFQILREFMVSNFWGNSSDIQILRRRTEIEGKKFAQHSDFLLCYFPQR